MALQSIRELVQEELLAVRQFIQEQLQTELPLIVDMSQHIFNAGGKQLRPLVALLACKAVFYQGPQHIALAAMLEFFHTATLLHDDVIDESKLRRGQDTAHEIWGNKAAVLVGDYLFTIHTQLIIGMRNLDILDFMTQIASKIGQGEIKQLLHRHEMYLKQSEYFEIIQAKTSLLFAAAASIAGMLQGHYAQPLYHYGLHLGNSFQLIDDILDYCSDSTIIGKNIGDDLTDGKMTLPLIYALEQSDPQQKQILQQNLQNQSQKNFQQVFDIIQKTGAIHYVREVAKQEAALAKQALNILPNSIYKDALIHLADYNINREQ